MREILLTIKNRSCIAIAFSYAAIGLNQIVVGILARETIDAPLFGSFIILGVVMLVMVPISLLDSRKEMRGPFYLALMGIVHLVDCIFLSCEFSPWWMAVYGAEAALCLCVILFPGKQQRRK